MGPYRTVYFKRNGQRTKCLDILGIQGTAKCISGFNQVSVNTMIRYTKERLSEYNLGIGFKATKAKHIG